MTFLLLLPAVVEGRGEHGSLGASVTAEGNDEPGGNDRGPLLCAPWTHLLRIALSQGALPPLPHPLVTSNRWERLAQASGGLVSCSVVGRDTTHGTRRKPPCLQGGL